MNTPIKLKKNAPIFNFFDQVDNEDVNHTVTLHNELCNEVYCQIIKQITNNKSSKSDSCHRGWKLLAVISCYFECTDLLKPYLIKYLENTAYDSKRSFNKIAQIALNGLKKTFKYGGRRIILNQSEFDAIMNGKVSKRQMFLLPGTAPVLLNIRSYTVVQDCIEQISGHLGILNSLEQKEFSIYCAVESEKKARPLNRSEYICDITTEFNKLNLDFYLIFKRVLWFYPMRFERDEYIDMMYNQILPDFREGFIVETKSNLDESEFNKSLALLSALQLKANDKINLSINDLKTVLPSNVYETSYDNDHLHKWSEIIQTDLARLEGFTSRLAKTQFLDILQKWTLFGATFYYIKKIFDSKQSFSDCFLAISKGGLNFLSRKNNKILMFINYNEIISSRRYKGDNNAQFIDLKTGDLMKHKLTKIETDHGSEISIMIGQYIDIINDTFETGSQKSFCSIVNNQKTDLSGLYLN